MTYDEKDDTQLDHKVKQPENKPIIDTVNISIAAIIAAEARMYMLPYRLHPRTAYTDTDSVITVDNEPLENMEVHNTKIGAGRSPKRRGYTGLYFVQEKRLYLYVWWYGSS